MDNGSEYISIELKDYLKHRSTHHELTIPYNPKQNIASCVAVLIAMYSACDVDRAGID